MLDGLTEQHLAAIALALGAKKVSGWSPAEEALSLNLPTIPPELLRRVRSRHGPAHGHALRAPREADHGRHHANRCSRAVAARIRDRADRDDGLEEHDYSQAEAFEAAADVRDGNALFMLFRVPFALAARHEDPPRARPTQDDHRR